MNFSNGLSYMKQYNFQTDTRREEFQFFDFQDAVDKYNQAITADDNLIKDDIFSGIKCSVGDDISGNISKFIFNSHHILANDDLLFIYNKKNGCYEPFNEKNFGKFLARLLRNSSHKYELSRTIKREVFYKLIDLPILCPLPLFNAQERYLNVLNGVIDLKEMKLLKHSHRYGFSKVLNFNFKKLTPDKIIEFLSTSAFGSMLEQLFDDEDDIIRLLEILGYAISNCYNRKTAIYFKGVPNSGKSTILNLLTSVAGIENISSISLAKMDKRFVASALFGKSLNIDGESNSRKHTDLSSFKKLTGGDVIDIEFKGGNHFPAQLKIKFFIASNFMLNLAGNAAEEAVYNRFEFMNFSKSIPFNDQDQKLPQKLLSEIDLIFSIATLFLRQWYSKKRKFHESISSKQLAEEMRSISKDSIQKFVDEKCTLNPKGIVSCEELWQNYEKFCHEKGLIPVNGRISFSRFVYSKYPQLKQIHTRDCRKIGGISIVN